ncbi:MAG: SMP-30/gluconolactonase/LRE family protein [Candidatus Latescibacterota bacterium]|jgi:sugar lactone lactonase YvrE
MVAEKIDIQQVIAKRTLVGEGALWDADKKVMYWVDILSAQVYIYDPLSGVNRTIDTCQAVGTVVPRQSGGLVVALHNGFAHIDLDTEKMTPIGEDPERQMPANRFNDGKCDPAGRLWAGTMAFAGTQNAGALYCFDLDHSVTKKITPATVSNGIVWSADNKTMYFIDSPLNSVRAYDYDIDTGAIDHERVVCQNEGAGIFDGMAIDAEGMLWIALYGAAAVKRYDPHSGALLRELSMPFSNVTSCAFGGENLDELYITSACQQMDEATLAQQPLAGSLVKIDPGCRGVVSVAYAG